MRKTTASQFSDRCMVAVRRPERNPVLQDLEIGPMWALDRVPLVEQIRGLDRPTKAALLNDQARIDTAFEERGAATRDRADRRGSTDHITAAITVGRRIVPWREK